MRTLTIRLSQALIASLLALALAACGFHLKNATPLAFGNIYTNINLDREFGAQLQRTIIANSPATRFVPSPEDADVILRVMGEEQTKKQLSIDADGRVEEYELNLSFTFEIVTPAGDSVLAPTSLHSTREIPYNERIVQAKESEIDRTFKDMRASLIDQIMRIISAPDVSDKYQELQTEYAQEQQGQSKDDNLIESKAINEQ